MDLSRYNKLWVALAAAFAVLVLACAPDATIGQAAFVVTTTEWYQVLFSFAGALGVYQVTNTR
jgi:predicted FMN-binding regulatory protein PaiB